MDAGLTEFESFEQQFTNIIGELQSFITSEARLRDAIRSEAARAEAAEAASAAAKRDAADSRANASAAAAGAAQASAALAAAQDQLSALKMNLELEERQRIILEEKCCELTEKIANLEREVQQLRPLQSAHAALQRQYMELEGRVRVVTEEARSEANRLESELRRVERCARGGEEVRERARLAAAAHARERRRAAADLQHTAEELRHANAEVSRLGSLVSELECRLAECDNNVKSKMKSSTDGVLDTLTEIRAVLEAEMAGAAKIEQALAAALADNATLAAQIHKRDNPGSRQPSPLKENTTTTITSICPIDSFLSE
ncbi:unnamed protein product [Parnassius apollo]|uniref:(apollo) hypothetical protein n=1 Tax=Parnassius apollo TaxID=110799 RepID=A0A8S3XLW3_PARAO|nr:unnamed protein product [Parnassius apollo]